MTAHLRQICYQWGLNDSATRLTYLLVVLAVQLIALGGLWLGKLSDLAMVVFSGLLVYCITLIRNAHLEAKLRRSIETVNFGSFPGEVWSVKPVISKGNVRVVVRNRTSIPINVREFRLEAVKAGGDKRIVRLFYLGPSLHVSLGDPDEIMGVYLPREPLQDDPSQSITYSNETAGDYHEIPPECGAIYGLAIEAVAGHFREAELGGCHLFVDYPTLFGRRKVLLVKANDLTRGFLQLLMNDAVKALDSMRQHPQQEPDANKAPAADAAPPGAPTSPPSVRRS